MTTQQQIDLLSQQIEASNQSHNALVSARAKLIRDKEQEEDRQKEEGRLATALERIEALTPFKYHPIIGPILLECMEEERKCRCRMKRFEVEESWS